MEEEQRRRRSDPEWLRALGHRIRQARVAADLRQVDLARALGIDPSMVSQWESGSAEPRAGQIAEVARLTGARAGWLLGLEEAAEASVAVAAAAGGPCDVRTLLRDPGRRALWGGRVLSEADRERLVSLGDTSMSFRDEAVEELADRLALEAVHLHADGEGDIDPDALGDVLRRVRRRFLRLLAEQRQGEWSPGARE